MRRADFGDVAAVAGRPDLNTVRDESVFEFGRFVERAPDAGRDVRPARAGPPPDGAPARLLRTGWKGTGWKLTWSRTGG